MKMTDALKQWLVDNKGLPADASNEKACEAAGAALMDDSLDHAEFVKLTADPDGQKAVGLGDKIDKLLGAIEAQGQRLTKLETKAETVPAKAPELNGGETLTKAFGASRGIESVQPAGEKTQVDVIPVTKMYDGTRKSAVFPEFNAGGRQHVFAGQRMFNGSRGGAMAHPIEEPSELDNAVAGAYFKLCLTNGGTKAPPHNRLRMTDHDWELVKYAAHEMKWCGVIHGSEGGEERDGIDVVNRKLTEFEVKALLDDTTSGGIYVTPTVFDDQVITTPLLNGEFYPLIDDVPITRGRRITGGSVGNVTLTWGGGDGTSITLFNTASFIAAFDTTIFAVDGAFLIGLDHISDSPVDVGRLVTESYGQAFLKELDKVIQVGNGTTQPTGVISSGGTSVTPGAGAGGAAAVGDFESLLFAVKKQYRQRSGTAPGAVAYGMTETSYHRACAIAVGASDARRAFWFGQQLQQSYENYGLLGKPVKISDTMTNAQVTFGNYKFGYRMYRRLGATIKQTTEGYTLVRANELMISMRARFGGKPTLAGYWALSTNWAA